jgi:hypothetical protein
MTNLSIAPGIARQARMKALERGESLSAAVQRFLEESYIPGDGFEKAAADLADARERVTAENKALLAENTAQFHRLRRYEALEENLRTWFAAPDSGPGQNAARSVIAWLAENEHDQYDVTPS